MRILLSAYACDPDAGTEPGNGWNWAWHLARAGHDVWVLTGGEGRDRRIERSRTVPNLHVVDVAPASLGSRVLRGALRGHLRYVTWQRRSARVAHRLHRRVRFDVVHHVTFGSLVWGSPLWRLDAPFVFGPVGGGQVTPRSLARYVARYRRLEMLRTRALRPAMLANPLARATLRRAALVLVTNADTERLVARCGAERVALVCDTAVPPSMIEAAARSEGRRDDDDARVLWLGRLLPRKGLPLAIESLSRTSKDLPWSCTIVGGGPLAGRVRRWLAERSLDDRVRWAGRLPWDRTVDAYRDASIFLFTSLRDASGAQLFEAAAFGLPMVGLRHQGMADLVPDDVAIKVPVRGADGTADGLARAIQTLVADPALRRAMSDAARRFARANTWPRRVQEVYALVDRAVAERPSA
jgi:glycosyltransferase involved in cell wall biosynthesis